MATADTDIEAENQEEPERSSQNHILLGGHLDADNTLREVLDDIMAQGKTVPCGILKILSKEVRGHIGIEHGTTIFGAHVTTTSDYGLQALKMLLSANRGLYTFVASERQPIELRQCLNVSVYELLVWRRPGALPENHPPLAECVDPCGTNTGEFDPLTEAALKEFVLDNSDHDTAMNAWGAGTTPVLKSTLSNIFKDTAAKTTAEVERIPMPVDFAELEQQITGKHKAVVMPELPMPEMALSKPLPPPPPPARPSGAHPQVPPQPPRPNGNPQQPDPQARNASGPQPQVPPQPPRAGTEPQGQNPATSEKWNANQLDSIPTPSKPTGDRPPSATHDRLVARNIAANSRLRASDDKELDQMAVSQRMQAVDPQAVSQRMQAAAVPRQVNRGVTQEGLPTVLPDKASTRKMIIGSVLGLTMALLLCQQVIEIIVTQNHFQMGLKELRNGNNTNALVELGIVVNKRGDFTRAHFYRALAETRTGQLDKALDDLDRVIAREPKNLLAYSARASVRIKQKDYDSAIIDCDQMLQLRPNDKDAYRLRAIAFSKSKRYKEAIDDATLYLETVKDDSPIGRSDLLSTRAYAYFKLKKFEEALADYDKAIELNPKVGTMYASRAIVHRELHDWPHALADADKASQLDPSDTSIFQLRGLCFKAMGDSQKALAELDRAVSLTPTVSMHKMRGEARLAVREFAGAMKDFDYVLSVTPDDKEAKVFYDRARMNLRGGPVKGADVVADAVKGAASNAEPAEPAKIIGSPIQLTNRGYELLKQGKGAEACAILKAALRGDPNSASARRYLAYALVESGQYAAAVQQFNVLQQISPLQENDKQVYARAQKHLDEKKPADDKAKTP